MRYLRVDVGDRPHGGDDAVRPTETFGESSRMLTRFLTSSGRPQADLVNEVVRTPAKMLRIGRRRVRAGHVRHPVDLGRRQAVVDERVAVCVGDGQISQSRCRMCWFSSKRPLRDAGRSDTQPCAKPKANVVQMKRTVGGKVWRAGCSSTAPLLNRDDSGRKVTPMARPGLPGLSIDADAFRLVDVIWSG